MARPLPSPTTAFRLAQAAMINAAELTIDAQELLASKRPARALSLGVIALEEIGKAMICVSAISNNAQTAGEFWKAFRDHTTKLHYAESLSGLLASGDGGSLTIPAAFAQAEQLAKSVHARRLSTLYVELADDGSVTDPTATVSQQEVGQVLGSVQLVTDLLRQRWTAPEAAGRLEAALDNRTGEFANLLADGEVLVRMAPDEAATLSKSILLAGREPVETGQ